MKYIDLVKLKNESGNITKDCEASSCPGAVVFTGPADNLPDACSFSFPSTPLKCHT